MSFVIPGMYVFFSNFQMYNKICLNVVFFNFFYLFYSGMAFLRGNDLKAHVNRIHENVTYSCDICNKLMKSVAAVQEHKNVVHEGKTDFQCKVCFKKFGRRTHLRRHIRTIHREIKNINEMILKLE